MLKVERAICVNCWCTITTTLPKPWRLTTLDLSALSNITAFPPTPRPLLMSLESSAFQGHFFAGAHHGAESVVSLIVDPPGQFLRTICLAVECPLLRTAVLHFFTPKLESTIPVHGSPTRAHFSIADKLVAACLGFYTITTYSPSATSRRKTLMYSGVNCLSPLSS